MGFRVLWTGAVGSGVSTAVPPAVSLGGGSSFLLIQRLFWMQFLCSVPLWPTGAGGDSPGRGSFALCCGGSEKLLRSKSME